jgi:hypothetical protein
MSSKMLEEVCNQKSKEFEQFVHVQLDCLKARLDPHRPDYQDVCRDIQAMRENLLASHKRNLHLYKTLMAGADPLFYDLPKDMNDRYKERIDNNLQQNVEEQKNLLKSFVQNIDGTDGVR